MSSHEPDEHELSDRMRAADPAAGLPPADPTRVDRLLEDVMSETDPRTRTPLTWLVAAAAVVLIAAAGSVALLGRPDPAAPPTAGAGADADADPTVTELTLAAQGPGRCMVPSAEVLGGAAYAVDGRVTEVAEGRATLAPTLWFAGEPTDEVVVAAGSADLQALIGAPRFREGERYLVAAADDGDVMVCGFSGPWTERLAGLYDRAFGG